MDGFWMIQDGNEGREADSRSSVNQKPAETLEPPLAEKNTKRNQGFNTLNPQPVQNFSAPCYTEKTGGLQGCQTPAPNLLGRHPADQQQDGW
jgi:hypothetical protein